MISRRHRLGKGVMFLVLFLSLADRAPAFPAWREGKEGLRTERISSPRSAVAEADIDRSRKHLPSIKETFRRTIPESGEIIHGILPWNWRRYWVALGVGGVTPPLILAKDDIQGTIGLEGGGETDGDEISFVENSEFFTNYEFLGNRSTLPMISGAFVLGGLLLGSRREVETGVMLVESLLFTAAVTGLGQLILAEERPYQGGELRYFQTHGHGVSGHSSVAASMVLPLDRQYLGIDEDDGKAMVTAKYVGKGILYSAPVMVGISRVRSNRHYLWNVVLGLAAGFSVGKVVADVHDGSACAGGGGVESGTISVGAGSVSLLFRW